MRMKNNIWAWIVLIAILIIGWVILAKKPENKALTSSVTVGAILPMTGPNAAYGEQIKAGMDYALVELDPNHTITLKIEDSEGQAKTGVAAFNKLLIDDTDVFVSSFSRVSVPVKDLAIQHDKPLIMTLVSAMSVISKDNPSIVRIFHNAETTAAAHVKTVVAKDFKKVGIVYLNDEYGVSVTESMKKMLADKNVEVVTEVYAPEQTDYRTQIQKIKTYNVDAVIFVTIPPATLLTFVKQTKELGLNLPLIDAAGVLPGAGALALLGDEAEGLYSIATPFDLGFAGVEIREDLEKKGLDKTYAVAYGYDTIKFITDAQRVAESKKISLADAMKSINSLNGLQGDYNVDGPEFNPNLVPVQIIGGKFVEVK